MVFRFAYSLKRFGFIWFLCSVVTGLTAPAYALDSHAIAQRFSEAFENSVKVSMDGVTQNGNDMVLKNVHIAGSPISPDSRLGDIILRNVKTKAHGAFSADKVELAAIRYRYETSTIAVRGIVLQQVEFPANKGIYNAKIGYRYKKGSFQEIALSDSRGKTLGRLLNGQVALDWSIRQNPIKFSILIPKVIVNVDNFPDGTTRQDFIAMGYRKAYGSIKLSGLYGGKDALMQIDRFDLGFEHGGRLLVELKIDGMSVDSLLTIATLQRENEHGKINKSRMIFGMLGQVQRYNFHGGGIRFEDKSLTAKILQAEAKREGKSAQALKKQWNEELPGWLSFAEKTDFFAIATKQMQVFLNNPQSLEITSRPMARLPVVMLAISGKMSPGSMVKQLNLSIAANR